MRSLVASVALSTICALSAAAGDWPEWRGPNRDGVSSETGLPSRWSAAGEGLAWKAPYGARATPAVFGNRLYLFDGSADPAKEQEKVQERLLCLDADTGKVVWEKRFNVFHSDAPAHRVAWASPSVDPATGNIYAFGVAEHLHALDPSGKLLWERDLTEQFGAISTHGARTVSPVIEGDLVIVSTLSSGWGDQARGMNRYFAFDKQDGSVGLDQLAAAEALRHQLLDAHGADRRRPPAAGRRRQRRHLLRARGHHRPLDLAARGQQARDPDERGLPRHHALPHAQRGEPRHERDGDGGRARRHASPASSRPTSSPGAASGSRAASPRRSPTPSGST